MSRFVPSECKYLDPQTCEDFKTYCTINKRGTCQRKRYGLDLPVEEVSAYLERRKASNIVEQKHIKRGGIKVSGKMTDVNMFNSILSVSETVSETVTNQSIVLRFFIEEEEILALGGYIKKMTEENVAINEKMRDYSGNSRYNSVNSTQTECNVLQINWIETKEAYRGNRFSIYAMYLVEQYAKQVYDIKYITLEDHTGAEPPKNLYYNLNFNLLAYGSNDIGSYNMWKDWREWAAEHGVDKVPGDERMVSIQAFESSGEIISIQQRFEVEK
jgi:hypothetical protein